MSKEKKLLRLSAMLFAAIWCTGVLAQPISPIYQATLPQFVTEMDEYYNGITEIPPSSISNFLTPLLPLLPSQCGHPDPVTVLGMNNSSISFDWPNVAGATQYRVGFLNLKTGASTSVNVNSSNHVFNQVPDGFYLFFFQAKCNGIWGKATIIIIDKVVALSIDNTTSCNCPGMVEIPIDEDYEGNFLNYSDFQLLFKTFETQTLPTYAIHFRQSQMSADNYNVNLDCGKIPITNRYFVFYAESLNGQYGTFEFDVTSNVFSIQLNTGFPYFVSLKPCGSHPINNLEYSGLGSLGDEAIAFPNPFNELLEITLPEWCKKGFTTITVSDIYARKWLTASYGINELADKHIFDTKDLSVGVYSLKIRSGGREINHKLVKL